MQSEYCVNLLGLSAAMRRSVTNPRSTTWDFLLVYALVLYLEKWLN